MRRGLALTVVLALSLVACRGGRTAPPPAPKTADPTSQRELSTGSVVGFAARDGAQAWLGIPFAKPPVGELRWRAPQPPDKWSGTREALRFESPCVQNPSILLEDQKPGADGLLGGEDCLYLNVYAPSGSAKEVTARRLPVMVWIHGGGNTVGHAGGYDAGTLAAKRNVVVVTTQYRLGPFGWFHHPALAASASDSAEASGNFGTLDLIRALEWVRAEAAVFGGDPNNVTIFGESAGGTDVFSLLVSPLAKGLFHKAISESGGLSSSSMAEATNRKDAAEPGDARSSAEVTPKILGADPESLAPADVAARLRAATPGRVFAAYNAGEGGFGGMIRMPLVLRDGHVIPTEPAESLLREGRYNRVPMIAGTNRDEVRLFMFGDRRLVTWWLGFLPRAKDAKRYALGSEYGTLGWKMQAVDEPIAVMRGIQGPTVFAYRFDWDEEPSLLWSDFSALLGAAHGIEIPFVFEDWEHAFRRVFTDANRAGREELGSAVSSYWTQFAYTGDPGRGRDGSLPQWHAWDPNEGGPKYVVLDTAKDGGIRMLDQPVTRQSLLAQLASDSRMDEALRCEFFADYVRRETFAKSDRAASGCSEEGLAKVAQR